jgi:hypothetical protein
VDGRVKPGNDDLREITPRESSPKKLRHLIAELLALDLQCLAPRSPPDAACPGNFFGFRHGNLCLSARVLALYDKPKRASQTKGGHAVSALIGILITFLVIILVLYLINMLPLDGRAKQIARVVVIIIGIISLLKYLAVF